MTGHVLPGDEGLDWSHVSKLVRIFLLKLDADSFMLIDTVVFCNLEMDVVIAVESPTNAKHHV
jgi:hypothetical protein